MGKIQDYLLGKFEDIEQKKHLLSRHRRAFAAGVEKKAF
jgi:hypothetical protein